MGSFGGPSAFPGPVGFSGAHRRFRGPSGVLKGAWPPPPCGSLDADHRGTAVRWLWLDAPADSHTVTSIRHHGRGLRFPGHPTAQWTGSYSYTFRKAGTYYDMCTVHDFMHGKIVVR